MLLLAHRELALLDLQLKHYTCISVNDALEIGAERLRLAKDVADVGQAAELVLPRLPSRHRLVQDLAEALPKHLCTIGAELSDGVAKHGPGLRTHILEDP